MAGTALDPGSRRIRASVTAAGSELTLAACQPCQPDRHVVSGGNLPLHLWAAPDAGWSARARHRAAGRRRRVTGPPGAHRRPDFPGQWLPRDRCTGGPALMGPPPSHSAINPAR